MIKKTRLSIIFDTLEKNILKILSLIKFSIILRYYTSYFKKIDLYKKYI